MSQLDREALQPLRLQTRPAAGEIPAWELLRGVETEVVLSELSAARILGHVAERSRQPLRAYPRWLIAAAALAISLIGLQIAAAAVFAGVPSLRRALGAAIVRGVGHPEVRGGPEERKHVAAPVATTVQMAPPAPLPALPDVPPHRVTGRSPLSHASKMSQGVTAAPVSSRPEVEIMTQAARELYADHDPTAALATLEPYLYLRPAGSLRPEMILAAVQADLELDRTPEALGLLDGLAAQDFQGIPRADELRVLRAELLERSQRCREALPVFAQSLAAQARTIRERALYGQASCRVQVGDLDGSRANFRAYLEQFPAGKFASEAERALGQKP